MFGIPMIEWVGYISSVIIIASLLMKDMKKLRIVNTVGCIIFAFYGFMVQAYPVAVMNVIMVVINIWFLIKMRKDV